MSTHLIFSKESKLAIAITSTISALLITFISLYKIVPSSRMYSDVETIIDLPGVFVTSISSPYNSESKGSLSSKLPSGISKSIIKMETEMFTNSFISSFSQSTVLKSSSSAEAGAEMPGKDPNHSIGKNRNNPHLTNETSFLGGNLKNRKLIFIDKVKNANEEGSVVVKLNVNPQGEVISAEIDPERTITLSASLKSNALNTSLTAIFEASHSSEEQTGFITFKFEF
ncbi:MAG: hypothetical protein Q8M29_06930 [Bacteroidota bacterium]|nr:hypothetical protein [Bacteroidota bacterium]